VFAGMAPTRSALEEMMEERGVEVDQATLNRRVLKYVPQLEAAFRARKPPVGSSWRLDETYVRIKMLRGGRRGDGTIVAAN
jgi:transposase-like protein